MVERIAGKLTRTIVLIGMMGAGKTTVGQYMSKRLGVAFYDIDMAIENNARASITEIFAREGEAGFRARERRMIADFLAGTPSVLAAGGGAFMDKRTRTAIQAQAVSIWLKADLPVLLRRIAAQPDTRPLLHGQNHADILENLLAERSPIYAEADMVIDNNSDDPAQAGHEIIAQLSERAILV